MYVKRQGIFAPAFLISSILFPDCIFQTDVPPSRNKEMILMIAMNPIVISAIFHIKEKSACAPRKIAITQVTRKIFKRVLLSLINRMLDSA